MASMERHNKAALKDQIRRLEYQLSLPGNRECFDCDAIGPRWASTNLGVFICMRCAGIHRSLGVHITKVKSINMDLWEPHMILRLESVGNQRGKSLYLGTAPEGYRKPSVSTDDREVERLLREKWDLKRYYAPTHEELLRELESGGAQQPPRNMDTKAKESSIPVPSSISPSTVSNNAPIAKTTPLNASPLPETASTRAASSTSGANGTAVKEVLNQQQQDNFLDFSSFQNAKYSNAADNLPVELFSNSNNNISSSSSSSSSKANQSIGSTASASVLSPLDFFSTPTPNTTVQPMMSMGGVPPMQGSQPSMMTASPCFPFVSSPPPPQFNSMNLMSVNNVARPHVPPMMGLQSQSTSVPASASPMMMSAPLSSAPPSQPARDFSSSSILAAFEQNPFGREASGVQKSMMMPNSTNHRMGGTTNVTPGMRW